MFECHCCSNKCLKGGKLTGNVIVTAAETNHFMCRKPQSGCKCIVDSTKEAESSGQAILSPLNLFLVQIRPVWMPPCGHLLLPISQE